jgi:murein L,D-transpeptidase YafK
MKTAIKKQAQWCRRIYRERRDLTVLLLAILASACAQSPPDFVPEVSPTIVPKPKATPPAPQMDTQVNQVAVPEKGLRIIVSKARRLLTVYLDGEAIHQYPIGLGFQPRGRKRWEGDGRTPEGRYAVAIKNPHSRYFLSLGLNYPSPGDASQGYKEGRVTWAQYQAIKDAFATGTVPPWNTRLGGEIFIHGHGALYDWTRGCIALDDVDMRELYSLVDVGTPVTIVP